MIPPYIRDMKFCDPPYLTFHSDKHTDTKSTLNIHHVLVMFESVCFELFPEDLNHLVGFRGEIISKQRRDEKKLEYVSPNVNF